MFQSLLQKYKKNCVESLSRQIAKQGTRPISLSPTNIKRWPALKPTSSFKMAYSTSTSSLTQMIGRGAEDRCFPCSDTKHSPIEVEVYTRILRTRNGSARTCHPERSALREAKDLASKVLVAAALHCHCLPSW